ncbi:unnamed protein product, partial [Heterotrigona itama]
MLPINRNSLKTYTLNALRMENRVYNGDFFIETINVFNQNQEMAPQSKIYAGNAVQYKINFSKYQQGLSVLRHLHYRVYIAERVAEFNKQQNSIDIQDVRKYQ